MLHDLTSLLVSYVLAISVRIFASLSKRAFIAGEFTVAAARCPSSYPRFLLRSYCSLKVFSTSPSSFFNIVSLASSTLLSTFEKSTFCTFSSSCCTFCRVSLSAVCVSCLSAFVASVASTSCNFFFTPSPTSCLSVSSALLSALLASSAASASFVAAFCSSVFTLSVLALVASVSLTVCSCCLTSVFTLALRSSSACLSAFVVSSVCSFCASGSVDALTAAATCACVWYFASSFVHR